MTINTIQKVSLIGVPLDLGASRRGVDMGPSALRIAGLSSELERLGIEVEDLGNLHVPQREALRRADGPGEMDAIIRVCRELSAQTAGAMRNGRFPIVLGGDHSLSAGSVAGAASVLADQGKSLGVIWLDAHSDINTPESSLSGNIHGMPVAHLLGHGNVDLRSVSGRSPSILAKNFAYIGLRSVDAAEARFIRELGIAAYTMSEVDERGLPAVLRDAIAAVSEETDGIYLSCDVDWIDPGEAPGVGTPVPGGATYREAHLAMEVLAETGLLVGMDLVEINPVLDKGNRSAELAVELIASALGKRTL